MLKYYTTPNRMLVSNVNYFTYFYSISKRNFKMYYAMNKKATRKKHLLQP